MPDTITLTAADAREVFQALKEGLAARDVLIDSLLDETVDLLKRCRRYESIIMLYDKIGV